MPHPSGIGSALPAGVRAQKGVCDLRQLDQDKQQDVAEDHAVDDIPFGPGSLGVMGGGLFRIHAGQDKVARQLQQEDGQHGSHEERARKTGDDVYGLLPTSGDNTQLLGQNGRRRLHRPERDDQKQHGGQQ